MEIFYNGNWGTVCDDSRDIKDARVVCRQLVFTDAISAPHQARFGFGIGKIWLDDVRCSGNESLLVNCSHHGWGSHNCGHSEDASVICSSMLSPQAVFKYSFLCCQYINVVVINSDFSLNYETERWLICTF